MDQNLLPQVLQIGTGAAFIIFPLIFIFAFSVHPGLLKPRMLRAEGIIGGKAESGTSIWSRTGPALHRAPGSCCNSLHECIEYERGAWAGLVGAILAVLGAIILAADKGALCLTMNAFDTLPDEEFSKMMPGLLAMFSKKGWMILLWGIILLPLGFAIQAIGLLQGNTIPHWQITLFLIGVMFVGTPDGMEIINLSASILMGIAMIPYGVHLITAVI